MKKRMLALSMIVLITSMFFQTCFASNYKVPTVTREYKFPDIYKWEKQRNGKDILVEHYAVREITQATNIKVISGYPDGTFRPDEDISREEFIKMLMVLATNRTFDFESVDSNYTSWAGPYVTIAEMQGVIDKGAYTNETLKKPITRLEMVLMLSKTQIKMKGIPQNQIGSLVYTDISKLTDDEKDLLLHAVKYDLLEGMRDGTNKKFEPNKNLTRGEAAAALMRIY